MRVIPRPGIVLLLATIALIATPLPTATPAAPCNLYASPAGDDAASGSATAPFRTVPRLVSQLSSSRPTGCLKGYADGAPADRTGLYELTETLVMSRSGITLRSADGQVAQVKGHISVVADDVTISGLVLDSRRSTTQGVSPIIEGDRVKLIDNDITSRGGDSCVTVRQGAEEVEIKHNRVHNCATGIRLDTARYTVVEANLVYRNTGSGLRLQPAADHVTVRRNILDRNQDNIVVASSVSGPSPRPDGATIAQNIASNPARFNLTDDGTSNLGANNTFTANCVYKAGDPQHGIDDVTSSTTTTGRIRESGTVRADPRYVTTRGVDAYRLVSTSPCRTLGGAAVDFDATATDGARPSQLEAVNLRPNIVFIVTDDQRADTMQMTPHVMPNTLKWFRDGDPAAGVVGGTEYANAFATTPLCCPSRASILSGRYSHNHGVITNQYGPRLLSSATLQRYLNDVGYYNAIFGKYLNGWSPTTTHADAPGAGPAPNFHEYSIFEDYKAGIRTTSIGMTQPGANEYTTDYVFDRAQEFVQGREGSRDGRPWFLYLAPPAPHQSSGSGELYGPNAWKRMLQNNRLGVSESTPVPAYEQPVEGADAATKPPYVRRWGTTPPQQGLDARIVFESPGQPGLQKQMLRALIPVDDGIARLFARLEATGEADDTLALFISDNGFQWREHAAAAGDCVDSAGAPRGTPCGVAGKGMPYVESVKVPFYVRWPGHPEVSAGRTEDKLVTLVDPSATVMDVIDARPSGAPDQPVMDGWSLLSFWERSYVLTETALGGGGAVPGWTALRTKTELYVRYGDDRFTSAVDPDFQEYYNLAADPGERRNLLGGNGQRDPGEPSPGNLPALLEYYRTCAGQFGAPGKVPCP